MAMTSDRLLEGLKRRISMPANQVLLENSDILAIADDIIKAHFVPMLVSIRQDYFVTSSETATVADQADYSIPYRAIGRVLRDLKLTDGSDTTRDLALLPIEEAHRYATSTTPHSFYFKGDKVVIVPTPPDADSSLQFWWELGPNKLVEVSDAALVTSVTADDVTVTAIPDTITAGGVIDFVQGKSGNATIAMDKTVTTATSLIISFGTDEVPTSLASGDYIALAGYSPVIQLPDECYPLLESRVGKRCLQAIGDYDGSKALDDDIREEEKNLKLLLEPRIQGEPTVILNRQGLLRGRNYFRRRGLFSE